MARGSTWGQGDCAIAHDIASLSCRIPLRTTLASCSRHWPNSWYRCATRTVAAAGLRARPTTLDCALRAAGASLCCRCCEKNRWWYRLRRRTNENNCADSARMHVGRQLMLCAAAAALERDARSQYHKRGRSKNRCCNLPWEARRPAATRRR